MTRPHRTALAGLSAAALVAPLGVGLLAAPAHAEEPITVVAEGLEGPFQVDGGSGGKLWVTEGAAGQITAIDAATGTTTPVVTEVFGASGATKIGSRFVFVTGEGGGPPEEDATALRLPPSGVPPQPSAVHVARAGEEPRLLADLLAYELAVNPDGQLQFDPVSGEPLDALSNPFYVIEDKRKDGYVLVADGGANAVLAVDKKGAVSTYFVPPTVNTGACEGAPNNSPATVGCDSVPTGLAYGPGGTLYVSALTAEAPGEGRVYVLDAASGTLLDEIGGFTGPTGVAVGKDGTVYVSEVLEGFAPGPGFDPADVGQIVKVAPDGERTYAQVTQPTGLFIQNGQLYSSAWALMALFLGIPDAGQVVRVSDAAFVPAV